MTTIRINNELVGFGSLSHSYPFRDLARILQRPYRAVLAAAEMIDRWPLRSFGLDYIVGSQNSVGGLEKHCLRVANAVHELTRDEVSAVYRVCAAPWRWQFPPEGRGL
jgi:hypothetical protein